MAGELRDVEINAHSLEARRGDRRAVLTPNEFKVFAFAFERHRQGRQVTTLDLRTELYADRDDDPASETSDIIGVLLFSIRGKLRPMSIDIRSRERFVIVRELPRHKLADVVIDNATHSILLGEDGVMLPPTLFKLFVFLHKRNIRRVATTVEDVYRELYDANGRLGGRY